MPRLAFLLIFFIAFSVVGCYGAPSDPDIAPEAEDNYDESTSMIDDDDFLDVPAAANAEGNSTMKIDVMTSLELDVGDAPLQDNTLTAVTFPPELPGGNVNSITEVTPDVAPAHEPAKGNMETTMTLTSTTTVMARIASSDPSADTDTTTTVPIIPESTTQTITTTPISSDSDTMTTMTMPQEGTASKLEFSLPTFFTQFAKMYAAMMEAKSHDHEHERGQTETRDYETMVPTESPDEDTYTTLGDGSVSFMGAQIMPRFENDPNPKVIRTFTPNPAHIPVRPTNPPVSPLVAPPMVDNGITMTEAPSDAKVENGMYQDSHGHGVESLPFQQFHEDEPENAAGYHGKCRHNRVAPLYQHTPYYVVMVHIPIPVIHHVSMTHEGMQGNYAYNTNNNNNMQQPYTPVSIPQAKI